MQGKRTKKSVRGGKTLKYFLFLFPGLIYLIINNYIPMIGSVIAFKKLDFSVGLFGGKWVGFDNFTYLFKTSDAYIITRNTLLYNTAFILLGTVVAVAFAIMMCEIGRTREAKLVQLAFLLPYMLSWVIVSYLVFALLSYDSGMINNSLMRPLGLDAMNWYANQGAWPIILVITQLWKNGGYSAIIYMATISGIDPAIMESAEIDGAGKLRRIWYITLPALKPTITIMVLISIGRIFYSDFGLFYQVPMDAGALYCTTQTIDTYVYRAMMRSNSYERSAAAGLYQSFMGFLLVLTSNIAVRKLDPDNALF